MVKWYDVKAAGAKRAEVRIFGDIGEDWWTGLGNTAASLIAELDGITAQDIDVLISSYGGSVIEGLGIYNALKRHPANIHIHITDKAISVASLIAMAGDTVAMAANALFMVHAPWSGVVGSAEEMREMADVLDIHADAMATSYMAKTGKSKEEIEALLKSKEDHWFTAEMALAEGFIDSISEAGELKIAASLKERFTIPAEISAAYNPSTKGDTMTEAENKAAEAQAKADEKKRVDDAVAAAKAAATAEALAAMQTRNTEIRAAFKPFVGVDGVQEMLDTCIDDPEITFDQANAKLLVKLGENTQSMAGDGSRIELQADASDKFRAGAQASILTRAGYSTDDAKNNYRGHSLIELARASLELSGVNTQGMDKRTLVSAAFTHSTGDFTNVLSTTANKAMLKGWDDAEETFQTWTSKGELSDFKATSRVDLNTFPSLALVAAGAEFKNVTIGDRGETVQLATYGNLFSINRQAIINDDLGAFTRIPQRSGRAAIRTVGDLVYAVLTANANMADGTALFASGHSNLGTGGVISTASVDEMSKLMALQTDPDGNATGGLNIALAYLIVPRALKGVASVVRNSQFEVGSTSSTKANTTPNIMRDQFEVVSDARLDTDSSLKWYGAANPAVNDTIEVQYLDGIEQPFLEQQQGWNVDGTEFKVRIDAAAKALDHRGLARNAGA